MHDATPPDPLLKQLEHQVAAALELPDEARSVAFQKIREAHPEHADLLVRAERAAAALEPELRTVASVSSAMRAESLAQAPPKIGDYKVLDVLGEGGMGIVYLGEQERPVRRRVAIKVTKLGMARDVLARFDVERHSLEMMNHPNIARVFDAGIASDGRPFFVLEHVPGIPIHEFCDRNRLNLRARIELFQKVCHGVQHAHQKGIIHRDLKPSNILVKQRDGFVEPKIIDFGVAKAVQQRLTEKTLYTEQGRILGTPEYMSPEQAEMSGLDIDTRSDVYSLGVLLYQLLAGVLPIDPAELRRAGYYEMQRRIREDEPLRPSTRVSTVDATATELGHCRQTNVRQLATDLKGDLDWIVMRCLEKDPSRRYPSASELASDLQRHLDDEPVFAGPPNALYQLRKLMRKHRRLLAAGAAVFASLVIGLGLAVWQWSEANAQAERVEASLGTAKASEKRALEAEQRIELELQHTRALVLAGASDAALRSDPTNALHLALAAHELDPDHRFAARVRNAMARQHLVAEFEGHKGAGRAAEIGPRSGRVLTASLDGNVRIWSPQGLPLLVLEHPGPVRTAQFSEDEKSILTICVPEPHHEVASVFDESGHLVARIGEDDARGLYNANWNADGTRLLVAEPDARVTIRDQTGAIVRELLPADTELSKRPQQDALVVHFFGVDVAVVCRGASVRLWWDHTSAPTLLRRRNDAGKPAGVVARSSMRVAGKPEPQLFLHPTKLAIDRDRERIATVAGGQMLLWNRAGDLIATSGQDLGRVTRIEFSPTGNWLLSTVEDGSARIWTRDGQHWAACHHGMSNSTVAMWFGSDERVLTAVNREARLFSRSGRELLRFALTDRTSRLLDAEASHGLLLTGEIGGPLALWRVGGIEGAHVIGHQEQRWGFTSLPSGELLTTGNLGLVLAFDADGRTTKVFDTESGQRTFGLAVSPDGRLVVAGGSGGILYGWDWETTELLWARKLGRRGSAPLTTVAFADGGRSIVTVQGTRDTAYWVDRASGEHRVFRLDAEPHALSPNWVHASKSGDLVAFDTRQGLVRLCNAAGETLADLRVADPGLGIWSTSFHPGGRWLTTGGDGQIEFWDLHEVREKGSTATPTFVLPGTHASWSPDGTRMLRRTSGSSVLTVWRNEDPTRADVLEVFINDDAGQRPKQFSADGRWLLAGTTAGARRWPVSIAETMRAARRLGERLGEPDLARYQQLIGERSARESPRD